ncbi:MAG TPA: hypothetical protein VFC24_10615 [Casimicrobiaceae bacterium]|nr:hypothetical protein [Casimicrobiaceae bacterium]
MWKRLMLVSLLAIFTNARAAEYTDVYYVPAESGWGVFLVQSDTYMFVAFFVYGSDGKPTWYTALLIDDGTGKYTGGLNATTGTFFGAPWNPAQLSGAQVGMATFQPTDAYHATLTYTVNGVTVSKSLQRQSLTAYEMTGRFSGSAAGAITACPDPTLNDPAFRARFVLDVTKPNDTSATLVFTFVDAAHDGIVCTLAGPLNHMGRLYQMASGSISCTGPGQDNKQRPAALNAFHTTGQGIEGHLTTSFGGGCNASYHFAAVFNVNN